MIPNSMLYITSALSLTEVGLGSLIHGLRIPLGGHMLSLNQAFLLSLLAIDIKQRRSTAQFEVSVASAILKTLAPAGKKLTPMLAIAAQGFLHNLGTMIFGTSAYGIAQANILCGLWSIIQPWLLYYLLYGKDLFTMALYFMDKLRPVVEINFEHIWIALWALFTIKSLMALAITWAAFKLDRSLVEKYLTKLSQYPKQQSQPPRSLSKSILSDLTRPLFVISFALMTSFYILTGTDLAHTLWLILRPLALALIIFILLRTIPASAFATLLSKMGLKRISKLVESTLNNIQNKNQ